MPTVKTYLLIPGAAHIHMRELSDNFKDVAQDKQMEAVNCLSMHICDLLVITNISNDEHAFLFANEGE